jgi:hypothetical protein
LLEGISPGTIARSVGVDCKIFEYCHREADRKIEWYSDDLLPREEPCPPASPTALTMAPWPATSWTEAKRPKAIEVLKYILNRQVIKCSRPAKRMNVRLGEKKEGTCSGEPVVSCCDEEGICRSRCTSFLYLPET